MEDKKFQGLLTSNIWHSKAKGVKSKIHLDYWKDNRYRHLLTPSIFSISINNIDEGIKLFEEYNISEYIITNSLRKNQREQRKLIEYMMTNNISLIIVEENGKEKLNPILNTSTPKLKEKYGIDIKKIQNKGDLER